MFPFVSEGGELVIASGDGGRRSGGNGSEESLGIASTIKVVGPTLLVMMP